MDRRAALADAFRSAVVRVGVVGLGQPDRCRRELARAVDSDSDDVGALVDASELIAYAIATGGDLELVDALRTRGHREDTVRWVAALWAPALDQLRPAAAAQPVAPQRDTNGDASTTILLTRVDGPTRYWERDASSMRAALALQDELLHAAVLARRGKVVKHTGDGVCAVFTTPYDAAAAAIDGQRILTRAPWPEGSALSVRMVVDSAGAGPRLGDIETSTLARAANLLDVAHGGQVILSDACERFFRGDRLPEGASLMPLGAVQLRDAAAPQIVFLLVHPDLRVDVGQRAPGPSAHRVASRHARLVGRDDDTDAVADLLTRARVVTLVGPGGVGKTSLAQEVAASLSTRFEDGAWMCELAPVSADADAVEAIASALGVRQRQDDSALDDVIRWLGERQLLLLIDNCEHLVDQMAAFVPEVLRSCGAVRCLLTSREALGVAGERIWPTKPLLVPSASDIPLEQLLRAPAVALFVERATAARPDFVCSESVASDVVEICRRLDGMPLAIELAAARMNAFGPSDILGHLDHRFRLLGDRRREPRQTLRGAVDWSHDLLSEPQRELFRRLAVFAGGWSLDAAKMVCAARTDDPLEVVDLLAELVAKSLVTAEPRAGSTRYRMLETLREYANEQLATHGELDELRRRHLRWALSLASSAAPQLQGPDENAAAVVLQDERDNLREALTRAAAEGDVDAGLALVAALEDYTILHLDYEVAAWAERLLSIEGSLTHQLRHVALGLVAHGAWARGDNEQAMQIGLDALAMERATNGRPSWAARGALGNAVWFRGWLDQTAQHFLEWIDRARQTGDDFHLAWGLSQWAVASAFLDRSDVNQALMEEAIALARRCDNPFLIAFALYGKSEWVIDHDPGLALELLHEGVAAGARSGNRYSHGLCLSTLASLVGRVGDPAEALGLYADAIQNWRAAGNWSNQRILLRNLAEFAARHNDPELTATLLGALRTSGEMNDADIGPEGARLDAAIAQARAALGDDRYDQLAAQAGHVRHDALLDTALGHIEQTRTQSAPPIDRMIRPVAAPVAAALSARESEIAGLVGAGLSNREIGTRLFISERTVDTHITRIRQKLAITSRTQLAVWAVSHQPAQHEPADTTT